MMRSYVVGIIKDTERSLRKAGKNTGGNKARKQEFSKYLSDMSNYRDKPNFSEKKRRDNNRGKGTRFLDWKSR